MKAKLGRRYLGASSSTTSFSIYLKPGALAKLRDSRITARSRQVSRQAVLALIQLDRSSDPAFPAPSSPVVSMEVVPCFRLRSARYHPLCLQRKKLVSVTPLFCDTPSQQSRVDG